MARIVTVHGTFASGPLEGDKWWQHGSRLTRALRYWVESKDGPLVIDPMIWDGRNSETARRQAGEALAEKLELIEEAGEPFVVVGHSHGGSVISAALLSAAGRRKSLDHLRGWITVGTPFIRTERQRFLFSRLGIFGKAIYLTLSTFLVLGALAMFVQAEGRTALEWLVALVMFAGPMGLFYLLLRYLEKRRSLRFNSAAVSLAANSFGARWLSLWHAKDEAVQSLKAVRTLDVEIFSRNFAVSALNLLAVAVVPLVFLVVLTSAPTMDAIAQSTFSKFAITPPDDIFGARGHNIFQNAAVLLLAIVVWPASLIFPDLAFIENLPQLTQFGLLVMTIGLLILTAVILTLLFNGLASLLSNGLSRVLNPMTLAQIKAVAYGSDAREDLAVDAGEWPIWLTRGYPPLPKEIADGLELASDRAIGSAIPKFRNVIESLTAADTPEATSDVLADYLTWQELIHTGYFDDARFARLLAYAICRCDGFRPSEAFLADPEFHLVERCYHEIVGAAISDAEAA